MTHSNGTVQNGKAIDVDKYAVSPSSPEKVTDLIQEIASEGKGYLSGDASARLKLLEATRQLTYALETPRETIIRQCWSQPVTFAAIETGVDLDLFAALSKDGTPKTVDELAKATASDPAMLSRIMKHLAATGVVNEIDCDMYGLNGFSTVMTSQKYGDSYKITNRSFNKGVLAIPEFLKKTNYSNPTSPTDTPFHLGHDTNITIFEHIQQDPVLSRQFNNHMSAYAQGRYRWMDPGFYPVQKQLIDGTTIGDQDVLMVDIGGSFGHDLVDFRRKWPDVPGRLVLQDLPEVVASVQKLDPSIDVMGYDFFTEQPIKGARAYYMHSILHDWPDDVCRKILSRIIAAMRPGHSKLLINENVVPSKEAYWETTGLDLLMLSFGGKERSEKDWYELLASAGLKIVNIWTAQRGVESLIECELAQVMERTHDCCTEYGAPHQIAS